MNIFNQIYDEINKLKVPDENLCDGDLDDYPEIYYNKAIVDCLNVLEKYGCHIMELISSTKKPID